MQRDERIVWEQMTVVRGGSVQLWFNDVVLAVRGRSVTSYIDGRLVNRVTLAEDARGGIALAVWGGGASRFRDPRIRHYFRARPD